MVAGVDVVELAGYPAGEVGEPGEAAAALDCSNLHIAGRALNEKRVGWIKRAGYQLAAFTINDPKQARRLAALGVDCIISDRPDVIAAAVGCGGGTNTKLQ